MTSRHIFLDVNSHKPYISDTATDDLKDICIGEFMVTGLTEVFGAVLVGSKEEMLTWAENFVKFVKESYEPATNADSDSSSPADTTAGN